MGGDDVHGDSRTTSITPGRGDGNGISTVQCDSTVHVGSTNDETGECEISLPPKQYRLDQSPNPSLILSPPDTSDWKHYLNYLHCLYG